MIYANYLKNNAKTMPKSSLLLPEKLNNFALLLSLEITLKNSLVKFLVEIPMLNSHLLTHLSRRLHS